MIKKKLLSASCRVERNVFNIHLMLERFSFFSSVVEAAGYFPTLCLCRMFKTKPSSTTFIQHDRPIYLSDFVKRVSAHINDFRWQKLRCDEKRLIPCCPVLTGLAAQTANSWETKREVSYFY